MCISNKHSKTIATRSCKPGPTIFFSNFPLTDHELLAFVLGAVKALHAASAHIQQNIVDCSYISQIMRLRFCQVKFMPTNLWHLINFTSFPLVF